MALETTVILRELLYQANSTDDIKEVRRAIEIMCSKEDVAIVKEMLSKKLNENER